MAEKRLIARIGADSSEFERAMRKLSLSAHSAASESKVAFSRMAKSFLGMSTLISTAVVAMSPVVVIREYNEFKKTINAVKAVSEATSKEMEYLTGVAKKMGMTTFFSATEAAKGMEVLGAAGFKTQQIAETIKSVMELAAAGPLELGRAAEILISILYGFQRVATDSTYVVDLLAKAAAMSSVNIEGIGTAFQYVGGSSHQAGISLKSTMATVSALGNVILDAHTIGTTLNQVLVNIQKPSGDLSDRLETLRKSFFESGDKIKDYIEIIRLVEKAHLSGAEMIELFDIRGKRAINALVSIGSKRLLEFEKALNNVSGAGHQMAVTKMEGLPGAFAELWSTTKGLAVSLGEKLAPALEKTTRGLTELLRGLADLKRLKFEIQPTYEELNRQAAALHEINIRIKELKESGALTKEERAEYRKLLDSQKAILEDIETRLKKPITTGVEDALKRQGEDLEESEKHNTEISKEEAKKRADIIKQFGEAYIQATQSSYGFELFKLKEAYDEFAKYIKDKTKLNEWYRASVEKLNQQELESTIQMYEEIHQKAWDKSVEDFETFSKIKEDINQDYLEATLTDEKYTLQKIEDKNREHLGELDYLWMTGAISYEEWEKMRAEVSKLQNAEIAKEHKKTVDDMIEKGKDWVTKLVAGTQSFSDSFKDMWQGIKEFFIRALADMLIKWILFRTGILKAPIVVSVLSSLGVGGIGQGAGGTGGGLGGLSNLTSLAGLLRGGGNLTTLAGIGSLFLGKQIGGVGGGILSLLGGGIGGYGLGAAAGGTIAASLGVSTAAGLTSMALGGLLGGGVGLLAAALLGGGGLFGGLFGGKKANRPAPRHKAFAAYQSLEGITDPVEAMNVLFGGMIQTGLDKYASVALKLGGVLDQFAEFGGHIERWASDMEITGDEAKAYLDILKGINEQWKAQGANAGKLQGYGQQAIDALNLVGKKLRDIAIETGELIPEETAIEQLRGYRDQLLEIRKTILLISSVKVEKIRELRWLLQDMISGEPSIETMIVRWTETATALFDQLAKTEDPEGQIAILDQLVDVAKEAHAAVSSEIEALHLKIQQIREEADRTLFEIEDIIRNIATSRGGGKRLRESLREEIETRIGAFGALTTKEEKAFGKERILDLVSQYIASTGKSLQEGSSKQIQEIINVQATIDALREQYTKQIEASQGFEKLDALKTREDLEDQYKRLGELKDSYKTWILEQIQTSSADMKGITDLLNSMGIDTSDQLKVNQLIANMINDSLGQGIIDFGELLDSTETGLEDLQKKLEDLSKEETRGAKQNAEFIKDEIIRQQGLLADLETTYNTASGATIGWLNDIKIATEGVKTKIEDIIRTDIDPKLAYLENIKTGIETGFGKLEGFYTKAYDLLIDAQVKKMEEIRVAVANIISKMEVGLKLEEVQGLIGTINLLAGNISNLGTFLSGGVWPGVGGGVGGTGGEPSGTLGTKSQYEKMIVDLLAAQAAFRAALPGMEPGLIGSETERGITELYQKLLGRAPDVGGLVNWMNAFWAGMDVVSGIMSSEEAKAKRKELWGFEFGGITTGARPVPAILSERPGLREAVIPLTPQNIRMIRGESNQVRNVYLTVEIRNEMLDAESANKVDWDRLVRRRIFPAIRDSYLINTGEALGGRLEVF